MLENEYEYDYGRIANDADELLDNDWMYHDEQEDSHESYYQDYYFNLTEDID